jgi:hypothetical protein
VLGSCTCMRVGFLSRVVRLPVSLAAQTGSVRLKWANQEVLVGLWACAGLQTPCHPRSTTWCRMASPGEQSQRTPRRQFSRCLHRGTRPSPPPSLRPPGTFAFRHQPARPPWCQHAVVFIGGVSTDSSRRRFGFSSTSRRPSISLWGTPPLSTELNWGHHSCCDELLCVEQNSHWRHGVNIGTSVQRPQLLTCKFSFCRIQKIDGGARGSLGGPFGDMSGGGGVSSGGARGSLVAPFGDAVIV